MQLGPGLSTGCRPASGDREDRDKTVCRAFNGEMCDFNSGLDIFYNTNINSTGIPWDRCIEASDLKFISLKKAQGWAYVGTLYECPTKNGVLSPCPNNCLGVEASDIVAGGAAILGAATVGALSAPLITPITAAIFGIGTLGLAGAGGVAMMGCYGPFFCTSAQGQCCLVVFGTSGIVCPASC